MATVYDPIKIGSLQLKNRFVEAATVKNFADVNGRVNSRYLNNFELEADGLGLLIVTMSFVEKQGQVFRAQLGVQDDKSIHGLSDLADRIHKQGAKAALQIAHGGNLCGEGIIGEMPVGPSSIPQWPGQTVHALTTEEVEKIVIKYGEAAARAKEAGFDALELHACHGSLILQFLSPIHNQGRTDKYADPPTFLYECIAAVQKYAGKDYPLGVRLTCHEFMGEDQGLPGLMFEVVKKYALNCEKMGVHYIHASAGRIGHTPDHAFPPLYTPRGVNVKFAEELKKILKIPVMTVGRFQDPILIEKVVEDGRADMIAMCRPIIADPHLPKKMIEKRFEEIRKCMGCNWCLDRLFSQVSVECPMNPAYGWEKEYELAAAAKAKKVMVIGGGVGGMQAAYAAAKRGHDVTLYERTGDLGGQVLLASQFPRLYTRELYNLPKWLIRELKVLGVKIKLNTEVTAELIEEGNPDEIIVATGANEKKIDVPVAEGSKVVYLWDYLRHNAEIGTKVVLFGIEAIEAAASLSKEGKRVILLQSGPALEWPVYILGGAARREPLARDLKYGKVDIRYNTSLKEIGAGYVIVKGPSGEEKIEADTVMAALGRESENKVYNGINIRERRAHIVGDAKEVRNMARASHEGYWVGRKI